jgi:micrococcal nuclease
MKTQFTLILTILSLALCYSQSGKVIKIKDGDTVVVLDSLNHQTTLRLAEVDCPESSQAFGKKAKDFTIAQVATKNVTYQIVNIDRYGRTVAKVYYDGGKYLSEEIIKFGFGWHYKQYSTSEKLAALERNARKEKLGLWFDKNATAPWAFRKKNKHEKN